MNAIFTLPYSEYEVANLFIRYFKKKEGYSVFVPISRTEKGIDLVLTHRSKNVTEVSTFQIKSSRTYPGNPPKRKEKMWFKYNTWLNRFKVPKQADFIVLFSLYAIGRKRQWKSHVLIFSQQEMKELFKKAKRTRIGKPDSKFGFGFNKPDEAFLVRGSETGEPTDYSSHLLENRINTIEKTLNEFA